ncbi:RNA-binding S4 domain-containing protein [Georgenia sp. EYE_87]|uniref:RNA-binding S4 domain-containing protein n=1 Tax=Georgenia sp. EYE_87 TaxID=2853448 RepID=UPI002003B3F0|nr:RNA-binding S4 domain-containing protein [Georgenia sp. EYE_87]MCK6212605.1 RNA-binding S4 domain-containing protein [Georgenia sp. EYE_87]
MSVDDVPTVPTEGTIRLGQFLKLADLAESGAQARELIAEGEVRVDGEVETRRGRQLAAGMLVEVDLPAGRAAARVG